MRPRKRAGPGQAFLDITQDLEHQGQAPHSDAVKAEIQYRIQKQAFDEARFSMEDTRLGLAVILFPDFNENFTVVDDLDSAPACRRFRRFKTMAEKENPDMRVALETVREADLDVKIGAGRVPSHADDRYRLRHRGELFCVCIAVMRRLNSRELGSCPNLGYFLTATLECAGLGLGNTAQQTASGGIQAAVRQGGN